jgi:hypothetical protein
VPDLFVLPAGRAVERPDVLVGVDNVQHALAASSCDIVLVSLPPSMSEEDRHRIAAQLHAVVSIVRDGRMRARQVRSALAELGELHHILIGVGLVDVLPSPDVEVVRRTERAGAKKAAAAAAASASAPESISNGNGTGAPAPAPVAEEPAPEPEPEPDVEPEPEPIHDEEAVAEPEAPADTSVEAPAEEPAVPFTWPRR